jgi:hypothetical protein
MTGSFSTSFQKTTPAESNEWKRTTFASVAEDSHWYSPYLLEGVQRLGSNGSRTRHLVKQRDDDYDDYDDDDNDDDDDDDDNDNDDDDNDGDDDDDDEDDDNDLLITHSGYVLNAWISFRETCSSSLNSTHTRRWNSKAGIAF